MNSPPNSACSKKTFTTSDIMMTRTKHIMLTCIINVLH
ncbi:MAG: hypothetical protein ACC608_05445 [Anaerofustis sp.]